MRDWSHTAHASQGVVRSSSTLASLGTIGRVGQAIEQAASPARRGILIAWCCFGNGDPLPLWMAFATPRQGSRERGIATAPHCRPRRLLWPSSRPSRAVEKLNDLPFLAPCAHALSGCERQYAPLSPARPPARRRE